ncbi:lactate dehydrogenase-like 2-hydroxyacid dehydrogenase [Mucilaginibacter sp. UYP25]
MLFNKKPLKGLLYGKIGHLGMDVYEYEKDLFHTDHEHYSLKIRYSKN